MDKAFMGISEHGVVHVDLGRLDVLLNLVGELVIARSTLVDQARRAQAQYGFKEQVLDLIENTERVGRISEEIQWKIIKVRLVPIEIAFRRFVGLVDKLSQSTDKEIELVIVGERTEVDKRTINELVEPLVHLVRNCLDHGIETASERESAGKPRQGTITLQAHHEGNQLVVQVSDDGAGIDTKAVREKAVQRGLISEEEAAVLSDEASLELLFHSGFSTAEQLTAMSGRGIGLEAARHRVVMLGGRLTLSSRRGRGTRTRIELPLTTAIVDALRVGVGEEDYALPLEHISEVVGAEPGQVSTVEGRQVLELRGEALSLLHLADLVDLPDHRPRQVSKVVVIRQDSHQIGLAVDRIVERHDIVIKGMGRRLSGIRGIGGASIGGDGGVVMVLDVPELLERRSHFAERLTS